MSQLTGDATLKEGDVVQTSGLGGNSPADLAVGTVIKVKPDSFGLDREVYVKPYADVYGISVVTVVKRSAGKANDSERVFKIRHTYSLVFLMLIDAHLTKSFETWTSNVYFASSHLLLLAFMFAVLIF